MEDKKFMQISQIGILKRILQ